MVSDIEAAISLSRTGRAVEAIFFSRGSESSCTNLLLSNFSIGWE